VKYTYLLIDLFSVLFPFLFSFHSRLKFYRNWAALFPAMLISGLLFIAWDMYFTHLKVWGFNAAYLSGFYIGNLPVEEILFFLCIPYACVFTYTSLPQKGFNHSAFQWVSGSLIVVSVFLAIIFYHQRYTAYTFALMAVLVAVSRFILKVRWLSRFYQTYLILLLPFTLVNGLLTGTVLAAPVVWYSPAEILDIRILTIPVEDVFYGMNLILLNLLMYNWLRGFFYRLRKDRRKAEVSCGVQFTDQPTNSYP